jgi:hypothetical protein
MGDAGIDRPFSDRTGMVSSVMAKMRNPSGLYNPNPDRIELQISEKILI